MEREASRASVGARDGDRGYPVTGARRASVYVHFPYCLAKCPYCDFVSYATPRDAIDHVGYADAVLRELDERCGRVDTGALRFGSVFFGGGTPSLWDPKELGRVLAGIRAALPWEEDVEVTVECNPTSLDTGAAASLRDAGVNRLSIGTQSLKADQLRYLGRLHDPNGAVHAISAALASGIPRISTDLIFGLPDQTPTDASDQAGALADLGLSHLSCYQLTIEPGTQFGELAKRGRLPRADDGMVADSFVAIEEALGARGLHHYEISNYARAGDEARHNLGYWRGEEYLGLGCAAFGFLRNESLARPRSAPSRALKGLRYRNATDPNRYTKDGPLRETEEPLDAETLLRERIMLGLRLAKGFDLGAASRDLGVEGWTEERRRAARWLEGQGRLIRDGDLLRIPRTGLVWTDDTAARLF